MAVLSSFSGGPPYHPVVQLKFGATDFIVTIPPEHLQEFTFFSKNGGGDKIDITFIDHSFGDIEKQIFEYDKDRSNRPLLVRWGYPEEGLEQGLWHRFSIKYCSPDISSAGMRITLSGLSEGSEFATVVEPKVYKGKISTIVIEIAKERSIDEILRQTSLTALGKHDAKSRINKPVFEIFIDQEESSFIRIEALETLKELRYTPEENLQLDSPDWITTLGVKQLLEE